MAKEKKPAAAKVSKKVSDVLAELKSERVESGCTMSDKELAFLVKLCNQCAG